MANIPENVVKVFLLLLAVYIMFILVKFIMSRAEGFGFSEGTMVQLDSSHVPTAEDAEAEEEQQAQIRSDLVQMTGSP
jgi:preprotein translocase subunit SecF